MADLRRDSNYLGQVSDDDIISSYADVNLTPNWPTVLEK